MSEDFAMSRNQEHEYRYVLFLRDCVNSELNKFMLFVTMSFSMAVCLLLVLQPDQSFIGKTYSGGMYLSMLWSFVHLHKMLKHRDEWKSEWDEYSRYWIQDNPSRQ